MFTGHSACANVQAKSAVPLLVRPGLVQQFHVSWRCASLLRWGHSEQGPHIQPCLWLRSSWTGHPLHFQHVSTFWCQDVWSHFTIHIEIIYFNFSGDIKSVQIFLIKGLFSNFCVCPLCYWVSKIKLYCIVIVPITKCIVKSL